MNTIEIQLNDKTHRASFPESWNECTYSQLVYLVRIVESKRPHFIPDTEHLPILKLNIFMALTNTSSVIIDEWHKKRLEENPEDGGTIFLSELNEAINEVTSFIFTEYTPPVTIFDPRPKTQIVIAPDLTKCPYPVLRIRTKKGDRTFFPPSVGKNTRSKEPIGDEIFQNMTIYELGTAFQLYENWLESNDDEHLYELLATIYREKKPNTKENKAKNYEGDIRLPLRTYEATISHRKTMISQSIPSHAKDVLVFWFGCCRHHFAACYPEVFSSEGSGSNQFGYAAIILELSRAAHVSKNEIADQDAHSTMQELRFEHEKAKAKMVS